MLAVAATASAQAPTQDSVTGTIRSPFFVEVVFDAHSGPNGENPSGTVDFNGLGDFDFDGPLTCLNVRGNVATFNIVTIFGDFPGEAVDNAGTGQPDVVRAGFVSRPRGDCTPFRPDEQTVTDRATSGDLRVVDASGPKVNSVTPAHNATGVPRDAVLVAGFSEAMNKSATQGAFVLRRTSTGAAVSGAFSWYGNALIFKPSAPLTPGAGYTASISTAATSVSGVHLYLPKIWQFTVTSDGTPPALVTLFPADGERNALRDTQVVAAFNEAMDKAATQGAFSLKLKSTGATVAGSFSWYGTALLFTPSSPLVPGAEYTATVSTAAKDRGGNHLPTAIAWDFTVNSDTTAPVVVGLSPADGATNVGQNDLVVALFSEAMNKSATQEAFSLKRSSNGAAVAGNFHWFGSAGLIFRPSDLLAPGVEYTATLSTGARDVAGNRLAQKVWRFTVHP